MSRIKVVENQSVENVKGDNKMNKENIVNSITEKPSKVIIQVGNSIVMITHDGINSRLNK